MSIWNLFGRSPFAPLKSHMEEVAHCVLLLPDLFAALEKGDEAELTTLSEQICQLEHNADKIKNDIRNHLPKNLFLPIERNKLLSILTLQDSLADRAEDIAVMITLKKLEVIAAIRDDFHAFLAKNIEAFQGAREIILELHDLLESSFGGVEVGKVLKMVAEVAEMESAVDTIQHRLLKNLYRAEHEMSYSTFYLWQKIFEALGAISNLSENLAYSVRATLDSK